tara:strand:- start:2282 stop:2566 length:285 start_codon:yes stop_codon:yes gene_type:complete
MNDFKKDFLLLEDLSKQISDLVHSDDFEKIYELDQIRHSIITKIYSNKSDDYNIKNQLKNIIKENTSMVLSLENKLNQLHRNHNKFNKIFNAYS